MACLVLLVKVSPKCELYRMSIYCIQSMSISRPLGPTVQICLRFALSLIFWCSTSTPDVNSNTLTTTHTLPSVFKSTSTLSVCIHPSVSFYCPLFFLRCLRQFMCRQLMVVKHVFLCSLPCWFPLCLYHYFIRHSFLFHHFFWTPREVSIACDPPLHPRPPLPMLSVSHCASALAVTPPLHMYHPSCCQVVSVQDLLYVSVYALTFLRILLTQLLALLRTSSLLPFHLSFPLCSQRAISVVCGLSSLHLNYTSHYKSLQRERLRLCGWSI